MKKIGLYIHIPFCKSKCYYCDFNSFAGKEDLIPPYFNALKKEARYYGDKLTDYEVQTVFIGGGTPSIVEARYIYELMDTVTGCFHIDKEAEISIEANPGTLSHEKLAVYKAVGINRLSIGLQAWQDELLKLLGRVHSVNEFVENFKAARKVGFENINIDLMFGLPQQTLGDWFKTVHKTVDLGVEHISCYSLKIEENTVFGNKLAAGDSLDVNEELDREMYWHAVEYLAKYRYRHYEISNFAKPGYECEHNLNYWKANEYLGIGAGAHSYLGNRRFSNIQAIEAYISSIDRENAAVADEYVISESEAMSEFMILGLRMVDGVSRTEFASRFNREMYGVFGNKIEKLEKKQLLEHKGNNIKLTRLGLDVANQAFIEFI